MSYTWVPGPAIHHARYLPARLVASSVFRLDVPGAGDVRAFFRLLVVELGGPTMFARIGVMRALNRGHVREFNPSRKEHHWGRRKLKRDQ